MVVAVSIFLKQDLPARLALAAVLIAWPLLKKIVRPVPVLVLILLLDLYALAWLHFPKAGPDILKPSLELASLLENTGLRDRYFLLASHMIHDPTMPFNLGLRINADTIDSWSRLPPKLQADVLAMILPEIYHRNRLGQLIIYDQMAIRNQGAIRPEAIPLFSLFNVRWLISPYPWRPPHQEIHLREEKGALINVYENDDRLPRAFIVHRIRRFRDFESLRQVMADARFDLGREILVGPETEPAPGDEPITALGPETVALERPAPDLLQARVWLEKPGYLFLSESWYPGWQATIDDNPAPIMRADYAFRAVKLSAGMHRVNFSYQPAAFRIGLWGSLAAIVVWLFMGSCWLYRRMRISVDEEKSSVLG
jgi:hypothetical protein